MFFETAISFCFLAEIDIIPVGSNLVKLWGVEAGLFLMIDDAGQLRGTVSLLFRIYWKTKQGITAVNLGGILSYYFYFNEYIKRYSPDGNLLNLVIHWFTIFDHI